MLYIKEIILENLKKIHFICNLFKYIIIIIKSTKKLFQKEGDPLEEKPQKAEKGTLSQRIGRKVMDLNHFM